MLYLETDAPGEGLWTGLSHVRDRMTCPRGSTPDNFILRPIVFTGKSLSSTETLDNNVEREALGILHGL